MNSAAAPGKLILVRHGESEGNRIRRFTTSPAAVLTDLGRNQAQEAAARIARRFKPALVVSSPYVRARQTAEIIASALGLGLDFEPQLREQSFGQLAGQDYDAVTADPSYDPSRPWLWRPPGGETRVEVLERVAPVLDRLAVMYHGRELVVVSHGAVMASLWVHATSRWEDTVVPPNAGIVVIEHQGGRYAQPYLFAD